MTSPLKINSTADLPDSWKVVTEAYRPVENEADAHISADIKKSIIVLITENMREEENTITIIVSTEEKPKLQRKLRGLLTRFKKTHSKVLIADCFDDKVIDAIIIEHEKRVKSSDREMSEVDKTRLNDALDILDSAMNYGASDVHIEVESGKCLVKFRINTEMILFKPELAEFGINFGRICYTIFPTLGAEDGSAPGTYNHNEILEGDFTVKTRGHIVKGRMLNLPLNHGEGFNFILRLIDKKKKVEAVPLNKLNFSIAVTRSVQKATKNNAGLLLIAGITGSGKSTTMQNLIMNEVKKSGGKRKIITIEQPVEYPLPGVTQISGQDPKKDTPDSQNFSFDNLNRYFLRADPDSLGYGEVRDQNSAFAAYKGVESGHLVYATTHTRSAISCFPRLKSFGLSMEQISKPGFIAGIIYQHLLPKLCPHCSIPHEENTPIPPSYDENFVLNSYVATLPSLDFNTLKMANSEVGRNKSVIRHLQNKGILSSRVAIEILTELDSLNDPKQEALFKDRLNILLDNNQLNASNTNIRYRGKGCSKCFNGTTGVVPVGEALVPDSEFLSLVGQDNIIEAENYWRAILGGKTSIEDSYSKIFDGTVDPRAAELKLSKELNSH